MPTDRIIGIDPGNGGGIVVIDETGEGWAIERVFKLSKGEVAIADFLAQYGSHRAVAYLERVYGFGEGRSFNFGRYYGFVRGVLYALGLRAECDTLKDVQPNVWMPGMGLPKQKDVGKVEHRKAIKRLAEESQSDVTATDWNAAAILIALYGLRCETGKGLRKQ